MEAAYRRTLRLQDKRRTVRIQRHAALQFLLQQGGAPGEGIEGGSGGMKKSKKSKKRTSGPKQALGILAVISVLAGAAAFAIPAGNALVDVFNLTRIQGASLWFFIAAFSGMIAYYTDREEKAKGKL